MIYNWIEYPYQIDDAAIDCGMMLLTTCDPYIHEYVDPCSIVSDCLDNLWRPAIDRCEMVADIPWAAPWAFLRIDNTWNCVEFIDPAAVFSAHNTDEMVAIDSMDSAGYLEDKIISTDGSIIVSNTGSALDLSSAAVDSFIWLSDTPSSYTGHDWDILKVSWNELIFVTDDKSQRAVKYMNWDETYTCAAWSNKRSFINTAYYEWAPDMDGGSFATSGWSANIITIQKTWMYRVWMNGWFAVNRCVDACKMAVLTSWEPVADKNILLVSKVGTFTSYWGAWLPLPDTDRGENWRVSNFSETCLVKLHAWTVLALAIRVSWDVPPNPWYSPEVVVEWQTHSQGYFGSWTELLRYKYCWTQIGVARHSDITHNAQ